MSSIILLDQKRARKAWEFVTKKLDPKHKGEYYSVIRSFPSMIQSLGIGQSLAFLMSKGKPQHNALRAHLTDWLFDADSTVPWTTLPANFTKEASKLLERLMAEEDPQIWWYADEEAIAFSIWLKRFSESQQEPS